MPQRILLTTIVFTTKIKVLAARFTLRDSEAASSQSSFRDSYFRSIHLFVCGLDYAFTIFMFYHDGWSHPFFINLGR